MGKPNGFMEHGRQTPGRRPIRERILDWREVYDPMPADALAAQASRCMDCGIPFCHNGCPLGNVIPEWNDLIYKDRWQEALAMLRKTNNFPEFTGRVCPAPCEEACVLNIENNPVTIKLVEQNIADHAWDAGLMTPRPPEVRTGKRVAVVGSGPAGLAAADQLNQAGHHVTVFERADRIGGLLMYGIPNFKLEKRVVERRVRLMADEGVEFVTKANVGFNVSVDDLLRDYDAILLAGGSTHPRDLPVPGRELDGIHFAMEYLPQQNKVDLGDEVAGQLHASGKHVVILGGGDTGADCLGTALRQGAASIKQFELLAKPPSSRTADMPWPYWPMIFRTSSAHEEATDLYGEVRDYAINTKEFVGRDGRVTTLRGVRIEWRKGDDGRMTFDEVPGSEFEIPCDLCLLALGFVHPEHPGPIEQLGLELDPRGNVKTDPNFMSSRPGVFAAGDLRRGQSLVVWAISEGRKAAVGVDAFLMGGRSDLPVTAAHWGA